MYKCFVKESSQQAVDVDLILVDNYQQWLDEQSTFTRNILANTQFQAQAGQWSMLCDESGNLIKILVILKNPDDFWAVAKLSAELTSGCYRIANNDFSKKQYHSFALAWGLACYQFSKYKAKQDNMPQLIIDDSWDKHYIDTMLSSIYLVRDLINTPCQDMGPEQLANAATNMAHSFGALVTQIVGEDLQVRHYPAVYAVGKGSAMAPRLIDLSWGDDSHPKLTLVGKGVCFDSGGLDIKPSSGMRLMKKDMGGAAHVLGLAKLIMQSKLPVRLRVLIPAVENAVDGASYRPGDVLQTRKGLTVEVGNTDAEGRLILADALTEACSEKPDLLIDIATLTGAARVALGPDVPVFFSNDDDVADALSKHSESQKDLMWRLPLHQAYRDTLKSYCADLNNISSMAYGGAITAALFLESFIENNISWIHVDVMAWNSKPSPGRPEGGEAMGLRALYHYILARFK